MYLKSIFQTLLQSGLDYCIQNGWENMPESFPTDVDIFYRGASERQIDAIVCRAAADAGLLIMQKTAMGYCQFVYWLTPRLPEAGFQLELDFQSELSLKSMPHYYIPDKFLDRKLLFKGFYIPSPADEIEYTILRRTVKHNFTDRHISTLQRAFNSDPEHVEEVLRQEIPANIVDNILDLIHCGVADNFECYYNEFYRYVKAQSRKNNGLLKRISQGWYNITEMLPLRFLKPCGMDIALLAPDGGGKSTILEALKEYQVTSFDRVCRKYFRPGMFRNIGQYMPNAKPEMEDNPDPHGRKPDGILKSWIRFLAYLTDFTVGYYVKVLPLKWKRHLVIFDRYYYDYYVDMYRYHYSLPEWVPHFFGFLIPHPSITFVLYAPAEVLCTRKNELTLEETERQCELFKKVAENVRNAVLIDANRPVDEIVKDILQRIVEVRVKMTAKKIRR